MLVITAWVFGETIRHSEAGHASPNDDKVIFDGRYLFFRNSGCMLGDFQSMWKGEKANKAGYNISGHDAGVKEKMPYKLCSSWLSVEGKAEGAI